MGATVLRRVIAPAFEHRHPAAEDARGGEVGAQPVGDVAQILADHRGAGAGGLDPHHGQHRRPGHRDIGAGNALVLGHPEGAVEAQDMVDAQQARETELGAERFGQGAEAGPGQPVRVQRRQTPGLAVRREGIGGAPSDTSRTKLSGSPQVSAPPGWVPTARSR